MDAVEDQRPQRHRCLPGAGDQLLDEKRQAVAKPTDAGDPLRVDERTGDGGHLGGYSVVVQWPQRDHLCRGQLGQSDQLLGQAAGIRRRGAYRRD